RLARLLCAVRRRRDRRGDRPLARDAAHRGPVRELRRAPRARVPGRAAPDRPSLLHQLRGAEAGGALAPGPILERDDAVRELLLMSELEVADADPVAEQLPPAAEEHRKHL